MMAAPQQSHVAGALDYLTDAAHLLRSTAPETSAQLMRQRNHLMYENDLHLSDTQKQHVCGACGHIMIAGQGTLLKLDTRRAKSRQQKKSDVKRNPATRTKVFSCGHCNRDTRISLTEPPRAKRSTIHTSMNQVTKPEAKPTANASSKKRAKNRKAGLQALLSGQKTQASTSLSLADFMRK